MRHGIIRGWVLGIARILRCVGGVYEGGADSVPEQISMSAIALEYRKRFRFTPTRVRSSLHSARRRHPTRHVHPRQHQHRDDEHQTDKHQDEHQTKDNHEPEENFEEEQLH